MKFISALDYNIEEKIAGTDDKTYEINDNLW